VNLQNLPSRGGGPNTKIRKLLVARPEHKLVGADLGQIEARVLAWVGGQGDLLAAFAEGRDVYSEFASQIFKEEVRKPTDDDLPDAAKRLKALRHVGKTAVLGLGYRMGGLRFWTGLQQAPELTALLASGELSAKVAAAVVHSYRQTYPRISGLWKATEEAALDVIAGASSRDVGPLRFRWDDDSLLLDLPSGRWLRYPGARSVPRSRDITFLDPEGRTVRKRMDGPQILTYMPQEKALHGGVFVENAVQAIARDVLAEAMLRIEDAGLRIILHVHDEVVVEVPKHEAPGARKTICAEFRRAPSWATGLPLAVEGWESECYDK
jgi:DNA polymerase